MAPIRPALPTDAAAVTACVRAAYAPYVERIGREPAPMGADHAALIGRGEVWVVDGAPGAVDGVLVLRAQAGVLLVENVAVAPQRQHQGLGTALMAFAEEHARRLGLAEVTLYTNERMTENLRLYAALGYEECGRGVQDGYARVFFDKRLS